MPKKQIKINAPLLQKDFEGTYNYKKAANNLVAGNSNNINFENNVVAGDGNSVAGQTLVLGNHNIVAASSRSIVLGANNLLSSVEGMIIGLSNSITAPVKNFYLYGVNELSMTQSLNNVWIFGNPIGTYSIGTQSFQNTIAPTQSGIYFNWPIYLGPDVNIFNNNGSSIGNPNLNQVLTTGNTTGGKDIIVTSGDLISGPNGLIDFDLGGRFVIAASTSYFPSISLEVGPSASIGFNSDKVVVITTQEKDFKFNTYAFKEITTGDWNMDTTASLNVAHSLSATEWKTVRNVSITIRNDADTRYYDLSQVENGGFFDQIDNTNFTLSRFTTGAFDNASFDSTSYNRGWIRFQYKPD